MEKALVSPDLFSGEHVNGFFTTKKIGADPGTVSVYAGVPQSRIYMPIQQHTDRVAVVDHAAEPVVADAVITHRRDILIGVRVADCVPILLFERVTGVIAAVHAGWRGTAAGILKKTMEKMAGRFHSSPGELLVAIGPSIRGCCYAVDHDVVHAVAQATGTGDYYREKGGRYFLDLSSANRYQAISMGVEAANIWTSEDCTFCNPERYYSYRYAKGTTGRQGGFIIRA